MELKGQTIYVVCSFDRYDALCAYRVFADHDEAYKYRAEADKRERQHDGHAYVETVTIN